MDKVAELTAFIFPWSLSQIETKGLYLRNDIVGGTKINRRGFC